MPIFRAARLPLLSVTLFALVACGSIEEQCRNRHGASEVAYDQCVEGQHRASERMMEDQQRWARQNIPDF